VKAMPAFFAWMALNSYNAVELELVYSAVCQMRSKYISHGRTHKNCTLLILFFLLTISSEDDDALIIEVLLRSIPSNKRIIR
jgi:hypothetical protein